MCVCASTARRCRRPLCAHLGNTLLHVVWRAHAQVAAQTLLPLTAPEAVRMLAEAQLAAQAPSTAGTPAARPELAVQPTAPAATGPDGPSSTAQLQQQDAGQRPLQGQQQQGQGQEFATHGGMPALASAAAGSPAQGHVVWLDCDGKFDVQRVAEVRVGGGGSGLCEAANGACMQCSVQT